MIYLSRKNGNVGELRVIVTELDRAELVINGPRWINIDEAINAFNEDENITSVRLTASYAGDLKDSKIEEYMQKINDATSNAIIAQHKKEEEKKKIKVHSDGSDDEDEDEESKQFDEALNEALQDADLTCPKCGDVDKALVDRDGIVHECESCIKIDAYLKGKKEGYSEGYDKGYQDCMKNLSELVSGKVDIDQLNSLINSKKEEKNGK